MTKRALIIVDMQNDFMPGGPLGVKDAESIIPIINKLTQLPFDVIVASKDWHPKDHCSFASHHKKKLGDTIIIDGVKQTLWPDHCIQNTPGADFTRRLDTSKIGYIVHKGIDPKTDSYSAFFDNRSDKSTGLADYLQSKQIEEVYIAGVATDYCVKFTVQDAVRLHFKTFVIQDACKAVNLNVNDETITLNEMASIGATIIISININF